MSSPAYESIIRAATETRNIDFKAAIEWIHASKCSRFEILKDIASMANAGGGHIVVGRDEPSLSNGSLTRQQANSFDPTEVNKFVHKYLAPAIECHVEEVMVDDDILVVIDIPEFDSSPVIFQLNGDCGDSECRKSPHFRSADIFIRTKAQQSQRVIDPDDMREMLKRGMRKAQNELITLITRALSSRPSVEEPLPLSPYDEEYEYEKREFFDPTFYPWVSFTGHFDMVVKPVTYVENRLDLESIPNKIREFRYIVTKNGVPDSVPYLDNHKVTNFSRGCRMLLQQIACRQYEAVSLQQSGLYRVTRIFMEDYEPNHEKTSAKLVDKNNLLWLDTFVQQITVFYLLARNIARALLRDPDEEIQIDLRVDGLKNRTLTTNAMDPSWRTRLATLSTAGTENVFNFPLRTTLRELEVDVVNIAREKCQKILWTFGLKDCGLATIQRKILRNSEPVALP